MERVRPSQPALADVVPYDPKYLPADVMISANENPWNLPEPVLEQLKEGLDRLDCNRYPDPLANDLRDRIAALWGLERGNVLVGNAGDELLFDIALAWGGPGRTLLTTPPTFSVYEANARITGTDVVRVPRTESFDVDQRAVLDSVSQGDVDYVVLTSPNNPTGNSVGLEFVEELLAATDALVLMDEAYGEFGGQSAVPLLSAHKNLIVLRTFSKAYSAAGMRLGYVLAHLEVIRELIKVRQPYSVDAFSQLVGCAILDHKPTFDARTRAIVDERGRLLAALEGVTGVTAFPSEGNFLLVRIHDDASGVWQRLYDQGVLVRDFSHAPGLEGCIRVSVGTQQENDRFLQALETALQG